MQSSNPISSSPFRISYFVPRLSYFVFLLSSFVLGLSLSRLFFEAFFPALPWLGRPLGSIAVAVAVVVSGAALLKFLRRTPPPTAAVMLVNLVWLIDPAVDVPRAAIFTAGSLWIVVLLTVTTGKRPAKWVLSLLFITPIALLYLTTLGRTVGRADTFEFQVVAPQLGIVHPTGYPLYLLLGKMWTLLPLGSVAWRLNFGTAVYAVAAVAVLFVLLDRLFLIFEGLGRATTVAAATFGAGILAVSPTFWSQAVEAEVYSLHLLFVAVILLLLLRVLRADSPPAGWLTWAGLLGGLGLTHHLTTVFMAPPILLTYFLVYRPDGTVNRSSRWSWQKVWSDFWPAVAAFLASLSLYLYLPLRWRAVNGEPMGAQRFLEWVIGGRFQGALRWNAWRHDPTRYRVIAQLFQDEWPLWLLGLAAAGALYLLWRRWQIGLVTLVIWLGYTFYSLSYYVPDLNVFLLPAHLIMALWAAVGGAVLVAIILRPLSPSINKSARVALSVALLLPLLWLAAARFGGANAAPDDGRAAWGRGVLQSDLAPNGAILADSGKHPPLYYMQQAEGMRPDLDIAILPDEAAYRQQLDARLAAGQPVYLARFLPNLAAAYHLRAAGPLVEVSNEPLRSVPVTSNIVQQEIGPLRLWAVDVQKIAPADPGSAGLTLYWTADQTPDMPQRVYIRWTGGRPLVASGAHPVHNSYPLNGWRPGEVVTDYYLLPIPAHPPAQLGVEVAIGPEFTPAEALSWHEIASVDFSGMADWTPPRLRGQPVTLNFDGVAVSEVRFPDRLRPGEPLEVEAAGPGSGQVQFELVAETLFDREFAAEGDQRPPGRYRLEAFVPGETARCGWLQPARERCVIGELLVDGVSVPDGAVNFGDLIALEKLTIPDVTIAAGGTLAVTADWLALAEIADDWTVFAQVLDVNDRIVGQIDQFPLQGVRPTSSWRPGERIRDPLVVPIAADAPSGSYRLIIGFYRLSDLQRLPVVDPGGAPINDKFVYTGLKIEE